MVFSGPQGIYCLALNLAIFEDEQNTKYYNDCKNKLKW